MSISFPIHTLRKITKDQMKININLILRCTVSITIVFFKKVYNLCFTHNLNKVGSIYFGLLILLLQESDMTEQLHFRFSLSCIGEGNGNPLQCSCLENSRDGEAWWLPSMGSHRVGHDWSDLAAAAVTIKVWCSLYHFLSALNMYGIPLW